MKEKTPLSHKVVCFQMRDFKTSNSNSEVSKSNSWKITSFSENYDTLEHQEQQVHFLYLKLLKAEVSVNHYGTNAFNRNINSGSFYTKT